MPTIADQVATIEHDLDAARARIDELVSANAAFASANASLQRDNVGLQLEINDMKHYVEDTRAMAENLANSALDMLRASRRQVGGQAAPPADKPPQNDGEKLLRMAGVSVSTDGSVFPPGALDGIAKAGVPFWKNAYDGLTAGQAIDAFKPVPQYFKTDETGKVHLLVTPAQQATAEIMVGDSGDEQPMTDAELEKAAAEGDAHFDATVAAIEQGETVTNLKTGEEVPVAMLAPGIPRNEDAAPLGFTHCSECPDPPRCTVDSKWCDKVDGTMLVQHDQDDLPIFLKAPPAFNPVDRAIFG